MGNCTSNDPKVGVADSTRPTQRPIDTRLKSNQNGFKPIQLKNSQQNGSVNNKSTYPETTTKAPLAFVISFDENNKNGNVVNRPPPGRLQLEPLKHTPKQTQAMLDEKMRLADAKREKILADRAKTSAKPKRQGSFNGTNKLNGTYDSGSEMQNNSRGSSGYRGGSGQINEPLNKNERQFTDQEEEQRQKILNRKRIVRKQQDYDDDSDVEHDPNYKNGYKSDDSGNHHPKGGRWN